MKVLIALTAAALLAGCGDGTNARHRYRAEHVHACREGRCDLHQIRGRRDKEDRRMQEAFVNQDEQRWFEDRQRHGWQLPPKAAWPLRLPVIRHVRAVIAGWRVERHAAAWASTGAGVSGYDAWVIYAIARGWC